MITTYKFPLRIGPNAITLPVANEIVHVGEDPSGNGQLCAWVRLDNSDLPVWNRQIFVCGTGQPCPHPREAKHVGSVVQRPFIWHVYAENAM